MGALSNRLSAVRSWSVLSVGSVAEIEALRAVAREVAAYLDLEELEDSAIAAGEGSPLWALKVAPAELIDSFPSSLEDS